MTKRKSNYGLASKRYAHKRLHLHTSICVHIFDVESINEVISRREHIMTQIVIHSLSKSIKYDGGCGQKATSPSK